MVRASVPATPVPKTRRRGRLTRVTLVRSNALLGSRGNPRELAQAGRWSGNEKYCWRRNPVRGVCLFELVDEGVDAPLVD